jgi:hypothetical protein
MWNKFGIFLIIAIVIWLSPSWLSIFIPALKPYAVKWLILVVSPTVPSYIAVPLLAVLSKLIYIGIKKLIRKIKDWLMKFFFGAELVFLYDVEEIEIILLKGRKMKTRKDKEYRTFKESQKKDRKVLILANWETKIEKKK